MIEDKERLMKDEEKGALQVNEYLNNYFGHEFLTLQAIENEDTFESKKTRFEIIIRNGEKSLSFERG